jgi:murein L,D-transpeptidase YafK
MFLMARHLLLLALCLPLGVLSQPADRVPAYFVQLPGAVGTVLLAETNAAALHRLENGPNGVDLEDELYMSIGQNGVGKQRAWDRRTPLGIYFVQEQLDTSRLHERYGATAFPLDYPNAWDRLRRRGGDGIWIHGVDRNGGRRPPRDTDGCIALPNDDLLVLADRLVPIVTPIVITREIRWTSRAALVSARNEINRELQSWAGSIRDGDLHRYLSLYADDFSYRGMSRADWAQFRATSIRAQVLEDLQLDDVLIIEDPEEAGLYLVRFRQSSVEQDRVVVTTKRLYWRRQDGGALKIVAEDNG